jgi:enediyne biosynthesis protein E4
VSWGTGVYDFDNDGFLDILIFHGGLIHLIPQEHTLFRGVGGGKFLDVSREAGPVLSVRTTARGACFADYENNGKVDAFLVNLGAKGTLVHNISENPDHWVELKLVGSARKGDQPKAGAAGSAKANRDGIGARVEVFAGAKRWTAERVASSGYLSQDGDRMHFGLGAADAIDKILIHWPSGREQTLEKQPVDRVITIEEPK